MSERKVLVYAGEPPGARSLTLVGNRAHAACAEDGFGIADLSNPSEPVLLGHASTNDYCDDVEVGGSHAYAADRTAGVMIFDVSTPTAPVWIGSIALGPRPTCPMGWWTW